MSEKIPHPLAELTRTRLREFSREPGVVFWVFGFPLLMAIALGLAFRNKPETRPRVGLVATELTSQSQAWVQQLSADRSLELVRLPPAEAEKSLARAKVDAVILLRGEKLTTLYDPAQDKSPYGRLAAENALERAAGQKPLFQAPRQKLNTPGARYIDFLLPGLIGLNMMSGSMWGVGYNLVVARKRKLLRRYAVTPMARTHFLLSYFFSRCIFLVLELAAIISCGALLFGSVPAGHFLSVGFLAFCGSACFAGISLLIGARVENTETANGWMNLVQMPMWLLSGAFFSSERFPEFLQGFIQLLPLTALVKALRAVWNDGAGLLVVWPQLLVLFAWATLGFVFALRRFRWQ